MYARGMDLKTAAALGFMREDEHDPVYDSPEGLGEAPPHLRVFLSLASCVRDMHSKGLLLRSLRARHVLLTEKGVGELSVCLSLSLSVSVWLSLSLCHPPPASLPVAG